VNKRDNAALPSRISSGRAEIVRPANHVANIGSVHLTAIGEGAPRDRLIDGWRGMSVLLVIVGHTIGFRFIEIFAPRPFRLLLTDQPLNGFDLVKNIIFRIISPLPGLGVDIFFIISGYLITTLMMREEQDLGFLSVRAFYVRRCCRILPAFFAFLLIMFLLSSLNIIWIPRTSFILSGLFLCDLPQASCTWGLAHTWSLGVEEQFYLVWPILFLLLRKRREIGLAVIFASLIALSITQPLALSFANIAVGGLYALSDHVKELIRRLSTSRFITFATIAFLLEPVLASSPVALGVFSAIRPALLAVVFFGTIAGVGPIVRIVSAEWLRKLGVVSYSAYLWQQLSTAPPDFYGSYGVLRIPILFVLPAVLSYWLIEKPMIRVGHRLSASIKRRARSNERFV
jgi:peptidoglycan/LPS O-acetylase OafA/YrhL